MKSVELAEKLGISSSYLSEIEKGKKQPPISLINKYSDIFDINVSAILAFSEKIDAKTTKGKFVNSVRYKMQSFLRAIENAAA